MVAKATDPTPTWQRISSCRDYVLLASARKLAPLIPQSAQFVFVIGLLLLFSRKMVRHTIKVFLG